MQRLVIGTPMRTKGFTLIEILVVLVVIGIVLAVALISFGDFGVSRKQQLTTLQLQASIKSAQLDAILKPTVLGLAFTPRGYRYYRYEDDAYANEAAWLPLQHDDLSDAFAFSSGTTVSLLSPTAKTKNTPAIYLLPDGSITPFTLIIAFSNGNTFKVSSDSKGEINVEKV